MYDGMDGMSKKGEEGTKVHLCCIIDIDYKTLSFLFDFLSFFVYRRDFDHKEKGFVLQNVKSN